MCLEHPECQKLVYVSSTGAIPELPHGQKIKEVEEVNLDELEGWYSKSKAMATNNEYTAIKNWNLTVAQSMKLEREKALTVQICKSIV